jgi:hypothetical protein
MYMANFIVGTLNLIVGTLELIGNDYKLNILAGFNFLLFVLNYCCVFANLT